MTVLLRCSPNHTPIKCECPIKKRNQIINTRIKHCSDYFALNINYSKHGHMKWSNSFAPACLSIPWRERENERELKFTETSFDGRVLHHVVEVVVVVNVAADVHSVMADTPLFTVWMTHNLVLWSYVSLLYFWHGRLSVAGPTHHVHPDHHYYQSLLEEEEERAIMISSSVR